MALVKREGNIIQQSRGVAAELAKKSYAPLKHSEITNQATRIHGVQSEMVRRGMNIKHLQGLQELADTIGDENVEKIKLVQKVVENHTKMIKAEDGLQSSADDYSNTRTKLAFDRTMRARHGMISAAR